MNAIFRGKQGSVRSLHMHPQMGIVGRSQARHRTVVNGIAPTSTIELQSAIAEFETLMTENEVKYGIGLGLGDNSRGVFALRDFTEDDPLKGEILLEIPLALTLPILLDKAENMDNFGNAKKILAAQRKQLEDLGAPEILCNVVRDHEIGAATRLAAWFCWLCAHSPFWKRYKAFQPSLQSYMSLLRVPRDRLQELQDEEISGLVVRMQMQAADAWQGNLELFQELNISKEDFLWALECVSTRAFFKMADGVKVGMMCPFADMANHVTFPSADFSIDYAAGTYRLQRRTVAGPMKKGDEVFISYGTKLDNVDLLVKYGFTTKGNVNDFLPGLPEWGPGRVAPKMNLMVDLVMSELIEKCTDEVQRTRYTSVIMSIPRESESEGGVEVEVVEAAGKKDARDANAFGLRRQNESARWMLQQLEAMRASWPTTVEQDEARLRELGADASGLLPIDRFLVAIRLERKRLAMAAIEIFQLWLTTYAGGY